LEKRAKRVIKRQHIWGLLKVIAPPHEEKEEKKKKKRRRESEAFIGLA
jgi:hypothetical protein